MNWLKLGIPIVLGLAAGALNYWLLNNQQKAGEFVVVKEGVKAGDRIEEENLDKLPVPGDPTTLKQTFVRYEDRAVLYGRPVLRSLHSNDFVLYQDVAPAPGDLTAGKDEEALPVSLDGLHVDPKLIQVGDQIGFLIANPPSADSPKPKPGEQPKPVEPEYVGPFRVLSVGNMVNRPQVGAPTAGGDAKTITIALKLQGNSIKDDAMRKFLAAKYSDAEGGRRRILEVVLHPRQADEAEAKK